MRKVFPLLVGAVLLATAWAAEAFDPGCDKNHYILLLPPSDCPSPPADSSSRTTVLDAQSAVKIHGFYWSRTFPQPDGTTLVPGGMYHSDDRAGYDLALLKLKPDGSLDLSFGMAGMARVPVWGDYEFAGAVAVRPDGRIVLAGAAGDPARPSVCTYLDCGAYGVIAQLLPDGRIDPQFGDGMPVVLGIGPLATYSEDQPDGQYIDEIDIAADGSIVIFDRIAAGRSTRQRMIALIDPLGAIDNRFTGPFAVRPPDFAPVIEFYNSMTDDYFYTADRTEFGLLDAGKYQGWTRTHNHFHAWLPASPRGAAAARVCRLYGDLGTHFYSPDPNECDALIGQSTSAWILESRDAFRMDTPDMEGRCPADDLPVYRLRDRRPGINDRYTTSVAVRDQMIAQGWQWMGDGSDGAVMCAAP